MSERSTSIVVAAVEGGGTSFVVAVARISLIISSSSSSSSEPEILHREEIDSSHDTPQRTLQECCDFFRKHKPKDGGGYDALGIATFGPVGLNKHQKETYGRILSTSPKKSWRNVDLVTPLVEACQGTKQLAVDIETDVNAPALAEYLLHNKKASNSSGGVEKVITSVAYVTVGTGIGVGLVVHGKPVHGRMHPEGGHVHVQQLDNDPFQGYSWGVETSPYNGRGTVEGIASSVALTERYEQLTQQTNLSRSCLSELDDTHEIWEHCSNALANLCVTLLLTTSVEKIVFGGGIMTRQCLINMIQTRTIELLNGYLQLPTHDMSSLITTSSYNENTGLMGAIILAQRSYELMVGSGSEQDTTATKSKSNDGSSSYTMGLIHGITIGAIALGLSSFALGRRRSK